MNASQMSNDDLLKAAVENSQRGQFSQAIAQLNELSQRIPNDPTPWGFLARIHRACDDWDNSSRCAQRSIELDPNQPQILETLMLAQANTGDYSAMVESVGALLTLTPREFALHSWLVQQMGAFVPDLQLNDLMTIWLAVFDNDGDGSGETLESAARYLEQADPAAGKVALRNLSKVLFRLDYDDDAVLDIYTRSTLPLNAEPESLVPEAAALGAAYKDIADDYDGNALHQQFSQNLLAFAAKVVDFTPASNVLDVACGTGLVGVNLAQKPHRLVGIDISPDMIRLAEQKGIYDHLVCADLTDAMAAVDANAFDVITSSCALYHLADLTPVFKAGARALKGGGVMVFSLDGCSDAHDVRQTTQREYCHSRTYLRRLAEEYGFQTLRIDIAMHRAYPGLYCAFRKTGPEA